MQELLYQPKRADPSADGPLEHEAPQHDDPEHIKPGAVTGRCKRVLQRAERACADCSRAGIAIEARNTHRFGIARIDLAFYKALDMSVVQ